MIESNTNSAEILGPQPLLRDVLAELTFKSGRSLPLHVDSIDLGVFQEEARWLANRCFQNENWENVGRIVYVTGKKKVLVTKHSFKGHVGGGLDMWGSVSGLQKEVAVREELDERYVAMSMHSSQNTDLPFSSTDLGILMLPDSNPAAGVSSLIAGKTKNMLFFRGKNTPEMDIKEAEEKIRLWEWQLRERIGQFIEPGMNRDEVYSVVDKAEKALLKQICKKYDLQFFSGDSSDTVVVRQTL